MTMINIFNTEFETSLRIVIILSEYEDSYLTSDMIAIVDFLSIYSNTFDLSDKNLHGNSPFKFSEFTSKRELIRQALKQLVSEGFVKVNCAENGFVYSITENGLRYSDSFTSKYSNLLRETVYKSREYTNNKTERDLLDMINNYSIDSIRKEEF